MPHYVGENIRFDVIPPALDFDIDHSHRIIAEVFKVEGFTVQGIKCAFSWFREFLGEYSYYW